MNKFKILLPVLMAAGVTVGFYQKAFAKVDAYIIKDVSNNKLYQYDVKDLESSFNNRLFFQFMNDCKEKGIYMVHDDELNKYVGYDNVKEALNNESSKFELNEICKNSNAEKTPFYVYNKILNGNKVENEINFTKNDVDMDFSVFQLKETGNIRITGNNFNISNLDFQGELILTVVKNGTVDLNNVTASNIKIVSAGENNINLNSVKTENLEVASVANVNLKGNSIIKNSIVKEESSIRTEGLAVIQKIDLDTKNNESKVKLDGRFGEVNINNVCKLDLGSNTKMNKLNAVSNVVLNGYDSSKVASVIGIQNIKNQDKDVLANVTSLIESNNKSSSSSSSSSSRSKSKNTNKEDNKPSEVTSHSNKPVSSTTVKDTNKEDNKPSGVINHNNKPDVVTSASKHEKDNKPSEVTNDNNKPVSSITAKDTSKEDNKPSEVANHSNKPDVVTSASKHDNIKPSNNDNSQGKKEEGSLINKEKSSIMNINYVNYAVIVLNQGDYKDYNFYVDGKRVNVQRVNKEGTVIKVEVSNRKDKNITIEKENKKENVTLKYKEFNF